MEFETIKVEDIHFETENHLNEEHFEETLSENGAQVYSESNEILEHFSESKKIEGR